MCNPRNHHKWSRRTSRVPKGYLRYRVLKLLSDKPMSGAEIIKAIEEKTNKRWRPSPGSVYPLLSWLLDSGYTIEITGSEAGVRRYELTDSGKEYIEEHEQRMEKQGTRFFGPQFQWFDWPSPVPETATELVDSWHKMRKAGFALLKKLGDDYSESVATEAKKLVEEFTEKISSLSEAQEV
ncbi:MAG: PadR family transcriptional regulator [Candidatus Thorarchaeota archaeon]